MKPQIIKSQKELRETKQKLEIIFNQFPSIRNQLDGFVGELYELAMYGIDIAEAYNDMNKQLQDDSYIQNLLNERENKILRIKQLEGSLSSYKKSYERMKKRNDELEFILREQLKQNEIDEVSTVNVIANSIKNLNF